METLPLPPRLHAAAAAPPSGPAVTGGASARPSIQPPPHHILPSTAPGGALPVPASGLGGVGHSGQDDEALSSLLLLLRSNQSKDDPNSTAGNTNAPTSVATSDGPFQGAANSAAGGIPRRSLGGGPAGAASVDVVEVQTSGAAAGGLSSASAAFRNPHFRQISMDDLRRYFHLPIVEVARQLGICTTLLKKVCRRMRIQRWPYRQIRSITKSVQSLEMACLNEGLLESERAKFNDQIKVLQNTLDLLIQDPNTPVVGHMNIDGIEGVASLGDFVSAGAHLDLANHKPSSDVAAMLAAAAATASIENGESSSKRRKQLAAEEQRQHEEELAAVAAAAEASSTPMVIGLTLSGHALVTQSGRQRLKFTAPVQLAPLERRKVRSQKKLVPLIEPDICNFVHVEFLARTMLRLKSDKLDASLLEVQQQLAAESAYANAANASSAAMEMMNAGAMSAASGIPVDAMGRPTVGMMQQSAAPSGVVMSVGGGAVGDGGNNNNSNNGGGGGSLGAYATGGPFMPNPLAGGSALHE